MQKKLASKILKIFEANKTVFLQIYPYRKITILEDFLRPKAVME